MKKTLLIMFDFPPRVGGAQQFNWDMARSLPKARTVLVAPKWPGWQDFDRASGYTTYRLPNGSMEKLTLPLLPLIVLYVVVVEQIEWLWFSKYSRLIALCALLPSLVLRIPFGLTVFGEDVTLADQDFGMNAPRIALRVRDAVLRRAVWIVANSHFSASLLPPGTAVSVIHPCLPEDACARCHSDEESPEIHEEGTLTVLSVGTLTRRKGFDLVISAIAMGIPGVSSLRYIIAGTGPEEGALRGLARELRVDHSVEFVGAVSDHEKCRLYSEADVFVMPSRLEGFGIAFLEAASHRLCAIGSRAGGIPEAVEDGSTGILVDSESIAGLRRALAWLGTNTELRSRLGHAAQRRCRKEFCWRVFGGQWLSLFSTLADRPGGSCDLEVRPTPNVS